MILRLSRQAPLLQVSLMRQMEKSTRDFADWRKEREKEVMQLRRQVSLASLSDLHFGSDLSQ